MKLALTRYLETSISKLMWLPSDNINIWTSAKNIIQLLALMEEDNVISLSDLDDLLWSLIHRFKHMMDLFGSDLSTEFCDHVREDILNNRSPLTEVEEQEELAETKIEFLMQVLYETEAKIQAREHGLISEAILLSKNS